MYDHFKLSKRRRRTFIEGLLRVLDTDETCWRRVAVSWCSLDLDPPLHSQHNTNSTITRPHIVVVIRHGRNCSTQAAFVSFVQNKLSSNCSSVLPTYLDISLLSSNGRNSTQPRIWSMNTALRNCSSSRVTTWVTPRGYARDDDCEYRWACDVAQRPTWGVTRLWVTTMNTALGVGNELPNSSTQSSPSELRSEKN